MISKMLATMVLSAFMLMVLSAFMLAGNSYAQKPALSKCFVGAMTGTERTDVAKWLFFSISAHTDIKEYSRVPDDAKIYIDRKVAAMVTRLLTVDCLAQTKAALKQNPNAVSEAFRVVGESAMQELMMDSKVKESIASYAKYLDPEAFHNLSK